MSIATFSTKDNSVHLQPNFQTVYIDGQIFRPFKRVPWSLHLPLSSSNSNFRTLFRRCRQRRTFKSEKSWPTSWQVERRFRIGNLPLLTNKGAFSLVKMVLWLISTNPSVEFWH